MGSSAAQKIDLGGLCVARFRTTILPTPVRFLPSKGNKTARRNAYLFAIYEGRGKHTMRDARPVGVAVSLCCQVRLHFVMNMFGVLVEVCNRCGSNRASATTAPIRLASFHGVRPCRHCGGAVVQELTSRQG